MLMLRVVLSGESQAQLKVFFVGIWEDLPLPLPLRSASAWRALSMTRFNRQLVQLLVRLAWRTPSGVGWRPVARLLAIEQKEDQKA